MRVTISNYLRSDAETINRLVVYGGGSGINRLRIVFEDAASIAEIGVREGIFSFDEVDDYNTLFTEGQRKLQEVGPVVREISVVLYSVPTPVSETVTYNNEVVYYNGRPLTTLTVPELREIRRGDVVKLASRVAKEVLTLRVQEVTWSVESVTFSLGRAPYRLFEMDPSRPAVSPPPPKLVGLRASPAEPGVLLTLPPAPIGVAGVEIYVKVVGLGDFLPRPFVKSSGTNFTYRDSSLTSLLPGFNTREFKARYYTSRGRFGPFSDVVRSTYGRVSGRAIEAYSIPSEAYEEESVTPLALASGSVGFSDEYSVGGVVDQDKINSVVVDDGSGPVVRLGLIGGLSGVPAGVNFGLLGLINAGVYLGGVAKLVSAGIADCRAVGGTQILASGAPTSGYEWIVLGFPYELSTDGNAFSGELFLFDWNENPGSPGVFHRVATGSVTDLRVFEGAGPVYADKVFFMILEMPSGFFKDYT
jgi:hypothetical protein